MLPEIVINPAEMNLTLRAIDLKLPEMDFKPPEIHFIWHDLPAGVGFRYQRGHAGSCQTFPICLQRPRFKVHPTNPHLLTPSPVAPRNRSPEDYRQRVKKIFSQEKKVMFPAKRAAGSRRNRSHQPGIERRDIPGTSPNKGHASRQGCQRARLVFPVRILSPLQGERF